MKLPEFRTYHALVQLREMMQAPYVEWDVPAWQAMSSDELLDRLSRPEGIELEEADLVDLERDSDGAFVYKGHRVIVYIRDQWWNPSDPDREYKYHLASCETIDRMFNSGRRNRYVVTLNTSGKFVVRITNRQTGEVTVDDHRPMRVCKMCLKHLAYRDYSTHSASLQIYQSFSLEEFFEERGGTRFSDLPDHDETSAPLNEYSLDWAAISLRYRQKNGWRCEKCALCLTSYREWLHVHHKNHLRNDNREENLQVLCIGCHAEKDGHHDLKMDPAYKAFRAEFPRWQPHIT